MKGSGGFTGIFEGQTEVAEPGGIFRVEPGCGTEAFDGVGQFTHPQEAEAEVLMGLWVSRRDGDEAMQKPDRIGYATGRFFDPGESAQGERMEWIAMEDAGVEQGGLGGKARVVSGVGGGEQGGERFGVVDGHGGNGTRKPEGGSGALTVFLGVGKCTGGTPMPRGFP